MWSIFLASSLVLLLALAAPSGEPQPARAALRVCADPNNLPLSNQQEEGFENALARLVARDLRRTVTYTWWPQRRGFIRNTLRAGRCDVVMGIPSSFELAQPRRPYDGSTSVQSRSPTAACHEVLICVCIHG
jgi:mxaJ protein